MAADRAKRVVSEAPAKLSRHDSGEVLSGSCREIERIALLELPSVFSYCWRERAFIATAMWKSRSAGTRRGERLAASFIGGVAMLDTDSNRHQRLSRVRVAQSAYSSCAVNTPDTR